MVLQLPYQPFPEVAGIYHMNVYDPFKPYIYAKKLRWSYPVLGGGPEDAWIKELSSEPVSELLRRAVWAGYQGIYIDRQGYPDAAASLESQIRAETHTQPIISENRRFSFFSLVSYTMALKQKTPPAQWTKLRSELNPRLIMTFPSGVYRPDIIGTGEWRWCNQKGTLGIFNTTGRAQMVDFTGKLTSAFPTKFTVFFSTSKQKFQATVTSAGNKFEWHLHLKRGANRIHFYTNAPRVPDSKAARVKYFRMEYLRVR
jgi:phosphoglycerol transferase